MVRILSVSNAPLVSWAYLLRRAGQPSAHGLHSQVSHIVGATGGQLQGAAFSLFMLSAPPVAVVAQAVGIVGAEPAPAMGIDPASSCCGS